MQTRCPACEQKLDLPEELLGESMECPFCTQLLQLPDDESAPPKCITAAEKEEAPEPPREESAYEKSIRHGETVDFIRGLIGFAFGCVWIFFMCVLISQADNIDGWWWLIILPANMAAAGIFCAITGYEM